MHIKLELFTYCLDVLKTFLVIWTSTTDPDLYLVLIESRGNLAEGADDAFEC